MKSLALLLVIPALLIASTPTDASTLTDYNVVILGNFTGSAHVEGATFVGGNLTVGQMSEFNHKNLTPAGYDGLRVGGTISGPIKVMHGETASYNTLAGGATINCVGSVNCATGGADHSAERADLAAQMSALSMLYDGLAATGVANVVGNQVTLTNSGADDLAVFHVNAADIFFQNAGIELLLGPNATRAVINVYGNVNTQNTNLNGAWNYSNTLWNFVDGATVNLGHTAWRGSVLAPNAAVSNGNGLDGSLFAQSYTRSDLREIHGFFWTPDEPTVSVPDGGSLTPLLGALLAGLGLRRRFRA